MIRLALVVALAAFAASANAHDIMPADGPVPVPLASPDSQPAPSSGIDVKALIGSKVLPRSEVDRPDDSTQLQIKVWYVLPAEPSDAFCPDPERLWPAVLRRQGGELAYVATYPDDPGLN